MTSQEINQITSLKEQLENLIPIIVLVNPNDVPSFFDGKTNEDRKMRVMWAYDQVQRKNVGSVIGAVEITKTGINNSLFHGHNRYKACLFSVLDQLIEGGILVRSLKEKDGRYNYILANRIKLVEDDQYVGIVIKEDHKGNKYYTHTIFQKKIWKAKSQTAKQNDTPKLHPDISQVIYSILNVND